MVQFQVLDSQQADRVYINPPAQGEGHGSTVRLFAPLGQSSIILLCPLGQVP